MKQPERIVKKGNYYEIQSYEEAMLLMAKSKKEETQNASTVSIVPNEYITSQVPQWKDAREQYFCPQFQKQYNHKAVADLVNELESMALEEDLRDEDRKEIEKLIEQIHQFAHSQQIELNQLAFPEKPTRAQTKQSEQLSIKLTAKYNINSLTDRIEKLQSLAFLDLISLEHQLEIMLGKKKPLQFLQSSTIPEPDKEELNNLYNHFNSLSIVNNTQGVIDSISMNEQKHLEMKNWLQKTETIQTLNADFLTELKTDQKIIEKLEINFRANANLTRNILAQLKKMKTK